jgi:integrase/recombinase XerC
VLTRRPRYLFLTYRGEPIGQRSVLRLVVKYTQRAGLAKRGTLHTFITHKVRRGVPLPQVQAWAGHRNPRTTLEYAHVDRQDAQKLMDATSL